MANHGSHIQPVDWQAKRVTITALHARLAKLSSLTGFGLSTGSFAYSQNTATYHAEFGGLPEDACMDQLSAEVARLIDGRWNKPTRQTGVSAKMQQGHPELGGLGAIPFKEHVQARWAKHALELARSDADAPDKQKWWIRVARSLLATRHGCTDSLCGRPYMLWRMCGQRPDAHTNTTYPTWILGQGDPVDSPVMSRLLQGLRSLPPIHAANSARPAAVGAWCTELPLWENYFLDKTTILPLQYTCLLHKYGQLLSYSGGRIITLGDAVRYLLLLEAAPSWHGFVRDHLPSTYYYLSGQPECFAEPLNEMINRMPSDMIAAVKTALSTDTQLISPDPTVVAARRRELSLIAYSVMNAACGWRDPDALRPGQPSQHGPSPPHPLLLDPPAPQGDGSTDGLYRQPMYGYMLAATYTVKKGTAMQLHPVVQERANRHMDFIEEALGRQIQRDHPQGCAELLALRRKMAYAWRLKWENAFKITWWQLAMNAVRHPNNGSMLRSNGGQPLPRYGCSCGAGTCSRQHHFWDCAVAQAVVSDLRAALPNHPPIQRDHLWLMEQPCADVWDTVWVVVCLAAITAIEQGRQRLYATVTGVRTPRNGQMRITAYLNPQITIDTVCRWTRRQFWANLANLAAKGIHGGGLESMAANLTPTSPFLGVENEAFVINTLPEQEEHLDILPDTITEDEELE